MSLLPQPAMKWQVPRQQFWKTVARKAKAKSVAESKPTIGPRKGSATSRTATKSSEFTPHTMQRQWLVHSPQPASILPCPLAGVFTCILEMLRFLENSLRAAVRRSGMGAGLFAHHSQSSHAVNSHHHPRMGPGAPKQTTRSFAVCRLQ